MSCDNEVVVQVETGNGDTGFEGHCDIQRIHGKYIKGEVCGEAVQKEPIELMREFVE